MSTTLSPPSDAEDQRVPQKHQQVIQNVLSTSSLRGALSEVTTLTWWQDYEDGDDKNDDDLDAPRHRFTPLHLHDLHLLHLGVPSLCRQQSQRHEVVVPDVGISTNANGDSWFRLMWEIPGTVTLEGKYNTIEHQAHFIL